MPLPPDDVPRSPTGRVPQWASDEAAGRALAPTAWRSDQPVYLAGRRRPPRRLRPAFAYLLVLAIIAGAWVTYQRYPDRAAALLAQMTAAVETAADTRAPLPAAADRDHPAPGYEEAPGPLGVAPTVSAPSAQYAFGRTQTNAAGQIVPVAWSPCRPIHFVTDPAGAPGGFAENVRLVVGELSAATGLVFADDGTTAETPDIDRAAFLPSTYGDRWAPVVIQFADPTTVTELITAAGVASAQATTDPTTNLTHLVSGVVYLDTELVAAADDDTGPAYLPVLRHELAHLVGLGHVTDPAQLMFPVNEGQLNYQAGDLTGLAELGRGACAPGL